MGCSLLNRIPRSLRALEAFIHCRDDFPFIDRVNAPSTFIKPIDGPIVTAWSSQFNSRPIVRIAGTLARGPSSAYGNQVFTVTRGCPVSSFIGISGSRYQDRTQLPSLSYSVRKRSIASRLSSEGHIDNSRWILILGNTIYLTTCRPNDGCREIHSGTTASTHYPQRKQLSAWRSTCYSLRIIRVRCRDSRYVSSMPRRVDLRAAAFGARTPHSLIGWISVASVIISRKARVRDHIPSRQHLLIQIRVGNYAGIDNGDGLSRAVIAKIPSFIKI